jgi:cytochrome c oxidase subunit III
LAEHLAAAGAAPLGRPASLAHHFDDLDQQRHAGELGMWVFLATEFMFFGGLFLAYLVYRYWYPAEFAAGSRTMDFWLGTANTAILLTSSLTMALAVQAAAGSRKTLLVGLLLATALLGSAFLGIKGVEYYHKFEHHHIPFAGLRFDATPEERAGLTAFFNLYFVMTGLHAAHMVIGIAILLVLAWSASRGGSMGPRSIVVHNTGLYWHFVDLVWVYLFPFFYLIATRFGDGGAN